eukprot:7524802-Alexandrium_andersonii.AAC.1
MTRGNDSAMMTNAARASCPERLTPYESPRSGQKHEEDIAWRIGSVNRRKPAEASRGPMI